jgi:hypothetical protein
MAQARTLLTVALALLVLLLAYLGYSGKNSLEREKADYQAKYEQACAEAARPRTPSARSDELLPDGRRKLDAAEKSRAAAEQRGKEDRAEHAYQLAVSECRLEDSQRRLKEKDQALASLQKQLDGLRAGIDKALADLKPDALDKDACLKKILRLEADNAKLQADLRAAHADMEIKIKKLEDKLPQIDLLAYDQPKGKIVKVDAAQQTVYLNLGSLDLVKPGLTISVFAEAEYKPNAERKASIEVVEVADEHLCRARVTEIRNAVRRPLKPGDQLYNPMWTPGMREHVAIAGAIDLTGDGRDQTAEFVKALEKEGVIVDVWLDMKDLSVKGVYKTVNFKTSYLILGDLPETDGLGANDRIGAIHQTCHDLREAAMAHGVCLVNARRYMALAGMKVPKAKANEN